MVDNVFLDIIANCTKNPEDASIVNTVVNNSHIDMIQDQMIKSAIRSIKVLTNQGKKVTKMNLETYILMEVRDFDRVSRFCQRIPEPSNSCMENIGLIMAIQKNRLGS